MKTLVVSSNCSGGGKTTVTLGLMKALKNRGYKVQGFKSGPDYIDPAFHSRITGVKSRNLDLFLMGEEGVREAFNRGEGDFAIVEGVMGLYDGKGISSDYSTYSTSKTLDNAPIILVISPKAQSLTLCAELKGILEFRDANIKGVILNNISKSYYVLLKKIIEENLNIKVFGFIEKKEELIIKSRHLGLIQSSEIEDLENKIEICANLIEETVDLDLLIDNFKDVNLEKNESFFKISGKKRIGVAFDKAFSFYYRENLEILESLGEVIYFSPINDKELPKDLDFLYIGGGYPEVFKEDLSKNKTMLKSIKEALEEGLPCYAECGGLMYLTREIEGFEMVGFFEGKSFMTNRLNNFGYAEVNFNGIKINCHEFHKSKTESKEKKIYNVSKINYKGDLKTWECGYEKKNTLAGYPHIHFFGNKEFLKYILRDKEE
ncbi:cobyrinate a,c-diamide synthase [Clostridium thermobutyricum]|uniref:Cobyrinate a,c-diamide synthase n=1 Tax=Clostridium thermobutyricum DSM 4928 TaxID=1121339 RepID=A0A1V4SVU3_9CLOT|nr:cobyrinate a,c-diamide synthase [Clostridium thermobutyricum]OPX48216.1 cobyrinic acid A,C-diamide synthase [Clostridium thermobutyricum DSM 4928]